MSDRPVSDWDEAGTATDPEDYRNAIDYLRTAAVSLDRAAGAIYESPLGAQIRPVHDRVIELVAELRARIVGAFCRLCGCRTHGNERCTGRAPNPAFSCGCHGPCLHGHALGCCKKCDALAAEAAAEKEKEKT